MVERSLQLVLVVMAIAVFVFVVVFCCKGRLAGRVVDDSAPHPSRVERLESSRVLHKSTLESLISRVLLGGMSPSPLLLPLVLLARADQGETSNLLLANKLFRDAKDQKDVARTLHLLHKAALLNHPQATFQLALAHAQGVPNLLQKDNRLAIHWFRKAAQLGIEDAKYNLVALCDARLDCIGRNRHLQMEYLVSAAQANHTEATFVLANLLISDDEASALSLYLRASAAGHSAAAYNAGYLLANSSGDAHLVDLTRALVLFRKAMRANSHRVAEDAAKARSALFPRWVSHVNRIYDSEATMATFNASTEFDDTDEDEVAIHTHTNYNMTQRSIAETLCRSAWAKAVGKWSEFEDTYHKMPSYENDAANSALQQALAMLSNMIEEGVCCRREGGGEESDCLGELRKFLILSKLAEGWSAIAHDEESLNKAAYWHEQLVTTLVCNSTFAVEETDISCFNDHLATAVTLRRRAYSHDSHLQTLIRLGNLHPRAATHWLSHAQTPRVFHPSLLARPWWDPGEFSVARRLESAWKNGRIQRDLQELGILADEEEHRVIQVKSGSESRSSGTSRATFHRIVSTGTPIRGEAGEDREGAGVWSEYMLYDGIAWNEHRCIRAAALCAVLRASPEVSGHVMTDTGLVIPPQGQVTIFRLRRGGHILPHVGVTNRRLVLQFPLAGFQGVRFRVDTEWRVYVGGEALVFDDSFEHEVVHGGDEDRYVLYATLHHPQLGVPTLATE